ncbi:MAG: hypothetical protein AAGA96_05680 [Verrucomicrobiota bacterium]
MTEAKKTYIFIGVCVAFIIGGMIFLSDKKPVSVEIEDRMASLQVAIEAWHAEKGSPPATLQELGLPEEEILDIMKEPFQYKVSEDGSTVTLLTFGADRKPGGKMFRADKELIFTLGEGAESSKIEAP